MKKRVISILAALLCMATLLSACGKSSDGQSTDNAEGKKEITVAIYKDIYKTVLWRNWMPQPITGPTSCIK